MLGTQTHGQGCQTHFTEKEAEVWKDLVTCWRPFNCQEMAFSRHSNARPVSVLHPVLPVTTPRPVLGAGQQGSTADGASPAIFELSRGALWESGSNTDVFHSHPFPPRGGIRFHAHPPGSAHPGCPVSALPETCTPLDWEPPLSSAQPLQPTFPSFNNSSHKRNN